MNYLAAPTIKGLINMSRSRYSNTDSEHIAFTFTILLACGLWTHKAGILQAEHVAKYVALITATLVAIVAVIRFVKKLNHWQWRSNLNLTAIDTMTGLEFERYVAKLLKAHGFSNVRLTEEYDYGVDIIAIKNGITWGIQVKRYSGLVGADAVRQAVTALRIYHCDRAMVITNSTFSHPAIALAEANDCSLIDKDNLLALISIY